MLSRRWENALLVVWPSLWLTIAQSLVGLVTLGYYVPNWDITYMFKASSWLAGYRSRKVRS